LGQINFPIRGDQGGETGVIGFDGIRSELLSEGNYFCDYVPCPPNVAGDLDWGTVAELEGLLLEFLLGCPTELLEGTTEQELNFDRGLSRGSAWYFGQLIASPQQN
jgi:hypothetical protein